ncbi:MAG: iron-containing alcohol dehydrogenase, partial [Clostridia bacterium]
TVGAIFIETPPTPDIDTVRELYKIYRSNGCDSIVAMGGGSALEIAKGLKLLLSTRSKNILDCRGVNSIKNYINIPFVTVPTSSASGADVSNISLLKDNKSGRLMDFDTTAQLPQYSVLQPSLTCSAPIKSTALGVVDILARAIEAYCGLNNNPLSQSFCADAIGLVFANVDNLIADPNNVEARSAMMKAQALSAVGFSNSKSGIMHAIAYAIAEIYDTPYSMGLVVVMTKCLLFNMKPNEQKYARLAFYAVGEEKYVQLKAEERAQAFVQKIDETVNMLRLKFEFAADLKSLGVDIDKLSELAFRAYTESSVVTNAQSVDMKDILHILESCKGGSEND